MMRRIAVVGDTLEYGGEILSYQGSECSWEGHQCALIGGKAFCTQCQCAGVIAKTGGPSRINFDSREIALDGDLVLCRCATPPRINARLAGESWCGDEDEQYVRIAQQAALLAAGSRDSSPHDERFEVCDAAGRRLAATYYTVRFASGRIVHGVTDRMGRTARYKTNGAEDIVLYLGHREY